MGIKRQVVTSLLPSVRVPNMSIPSTCCLNVSTKCEYIDTLLGRKQMGGLSSAEGEQGGRCRFPDAIEHHQAGGPELARRQYTMSLSSKGTMVAPGCPSAADSRPDAVEVGSLFFEESEPDEAGVAEGCDADDDPLAGVTGNASCG